MSPDSAKRLKAIRDRNLSMMPFRYHSNILAERLVNEFLVKIPIARRADVVPILIFRASLVFEFFLARKLSTSPIGFVGFERDEETAKAKKYYSKLPRMKEDSIVVIFDPMLATGGTLRQTIQEANEKHRLDTGKWLHGHNIYFVGFLAAECGYRKALKHIPKKNIILLAVDSKLDSRKFIVPGLGDFGDRYFGD